MVKVRRTHPDLPDSPGVQQAFEILQVVSLQDNIYLVIIQTKGQVSCFVCVTGYCYVAQDSLKDVLFLLLPPVCWGYRYATPHQHLTNFINQYI